MAYTILKLFNGTTQAELESGGLKMFVSWERLTPDIEKAIMIRPDEFVKGYVIDEKGISVSIARKPGRKVNQE